MRLKLPSLRERTEDIPLLVQHFIAKSGRDVTVSPGAQKSLAAYPWRGNVRELENIIERALILSQGTSIEVQHLPDEFHALADASQRPLSLEDVEQRHIIRVLRIAKDLDEAANILGIDPTTLWRKRKKYGL
jgi:NtrC-family two-component system response regulator AlgB